MIRLLNLKLNDSAMEVKNVCNEDGDDVSEAEQYEN